MPTPSPNDAASRWSQNLGSATARITAGVQAVTVSPGQAAARNKSAYVAGVTSSVDKWASNVAAVPLASWQQDMINKGIPRIATGASAAESKFATVMGQLLPFIDTQVRSLPPRGNLQQNIARMTQFVTGMSKFRATRQPGQ